MDTNQVILQALGDFWIVCAVCGTLSCVILDVAKRFNK